MVNANRVQWLNKSLSSISSSGGAKGRVLYWMFRDKRVQDNWALLQADDLAHQFNFSLCVAYTVIPHFGEFTWRHHHFVLQGLKDVKLGLHEKNVPFQAVISRESPVNDLLKIVRENNVRAVVTDFLPLRQKLQWDMELAKALGDVPFARVDAHNIIPCWETSGKLEYAARTIRPKIMKRLDTFLAEEFSEVRTKAELDADMDSPYDAEKLLEELKSKHKIDCSVGPCDAHYPPGLASARKRFESFLSKKRLGRFHSHRNNPNHPKVLSGMSPYVNAGQVSIHRLVMEAKAFAKANRLSSEAIGAYVEEAVVRRELSDNFCFYNPNYDRLEGAYAWARETLATHAKDKREHVYSYEELSTAKTHDDLWNAAQIQLTEEGKLHGFLRMYWAKKVLEWTESPEQALEYAQRLNDRFALDGNDPNGYVGVGWSIMAIHDQGWREREVFGKIRYMNYKGCQRKFDVDEFVANYDNKQAKIRPTKRARKE